MRILIALLFVALAYGQPPCNGPMQAPCGPGIDPLTQIRTIKCPGSVCVYAYMPDGSIRRAQLSSAFVVSTNPDGSVVIDSANAQEVNGEVTNIAAAPQMITLLHVPVAGTEKVYRNGLRLDKPAGDYSVSGKAITISVVSVGDRVTVDYRTLEALP